MGFQWHAKDVDLIIQKPHKLGHLCGKDKLTELHDPWIKHIWDNEEEHASLQAHRGSYKTTGITEVGSIRWLLFHPNDRIGIVRKPHKKAADSVGNIGRMMLRPEVRELFKFIHGIYPNTIEDQKGKKTFAFKKEETKEGNLNAYGIYNPPTGDHVDKLIGDDFVIMKDRTSKAERQKTDQAIMEYITNIIDPGKFCGWVGTPWHVKDSWRLLTNLLKFPVSVTGLLSAKQIEEIMKRTTSSLFAANYKLEHISDENKEFKDPIYGPWDWKLYPFAHLDAKYDGDHTNALTFMAKRKDGKIQATGYVFNENIKSKADWVYEMWQKRRSKTLYNEENPDKGYTGDLLKSKKVKVKTYWESANKHIKIVTFLKHYWSDIVWDDKVDPEYMNQILDYVKGEEPDDAPDSAASLLREAFYSKNADMSLYE